jgi:hypothetical protein
MKPSGNEPPTFWLEGTSQTQVKTIITWDNYLSVRLTEIFLTQLLILKPTECAMNMQFNMLHTCVISEVKISDKWSEVN